MIKGGKYGNSTVTGSRFETDTSLKIQFENSKIPNYTIKNEDEIFYYNEKVGRIFEQSSIYKDFFEPLGLHVKTYDMQDKVQENKKKQLDLFNINKFIFVSSKLQPDEAVFVNDTQKLFIIEKKTQNTAGSVDEKLQTCEYKKRYYEKLVNNIPNKSIKVEFIYLLNGLFEEKKNTRYKDVLEFIVEKGCHYYFNHLSLSELGLPE